MKSKVTSFIIILLFSIIGIIGSCSHFRTQNTHIDSVLKPAFEEWRTECVVRGIRYNKEISKLDSILYSPLEIEYWGKCYGNKIIINSNSIKADDEFLLKLVLFHELGHCAFGYDHYELGEDIMNSILPKSQIILYHYFWDILINDYFSRYIPKKERKKLLNKLENQDCFCILGENKLQDNEEQQAQHRSNTTECTH